MVRRRSSEMFLSAVAATIYMSNMRRVDKYVILE